MDKSTYGNLPELTTRPALEAELGVNNKLRTFFVKSIQTMRFIENLPACRVPGNHIGPMLVEAVYAYRKREMKREWEGKIHIAVYSQLVSCYRNIYKNTINRLSSLKHIQPNRSVRPLTNPYDVGT